MRRKHPRNQGIPDRSVTGPALCLKRFSTDSTVFEEESNMARGQKHDSTDRYTCERDRVTIQSIADSRVRRGQGTHSQIGCPRN